MDKSGQEGKRAYWQGHVDVQKKSGLTQAQYCRDHGLTFSTFSWWYLQRKKAQQPKITDALTMVPIQIKPQSQRPLSATGEIRLQHHSGWQLSLSPDVAVPWLASLLKAIA